MLIRIHRSFRAISTILTLAFLICVATNASKFLAAAEEQPEDSTEGQTAQDELSTHIANARIGVLKAQIRKSPNDATLWFQLAEELKNNDHAGKATYAFQKALELNPQDPIAMNELGLLAINPDGDYAQAADYFRQAHAISPKDNVIGENLAFVITTLAYQARNNDNDLQRARELAEEGLEADPDSVDLLLEYALILHALDQIDAAEEVLQKTPVSYMTLPAWFEAINIESRDNHFNLAAFLLNHLRPRMEHKEDLLSTEANDYNARGFAIRGADNYDDSRALHERALRLNPTSHDAYNGLALVAHETAQYETARELYEKAISLAPDMYRYKLNLCHLLKDTEEYEAARAQLFTLIKEVPDDEETIELLTTVYILHGYQLYYDDSNKVGAALEVFREGEAHAPNSPPILNGIGVCLETMGHIDTARDHFRRAIALSNTYPWAHLNEGRLLLFENHIPEGIAHLEEAWKRDPDEEEITALLAWGYFLKSVDTDAATDQAWAHRQLTSLYPDAPAAYVAISTYLLDTDHADEGIRVLEHGLKENPTHVELLRLRANAHAMQHEFQTAIDIYDHLIEQHPLSPTLVYAYVNICTAWANEEADADLADAHYNRAEDMLKRALSLEAPAAIYNRLGNLAWERKRFNDAKSYYQTAIEQDATYAFSHSNLGSILLDEGDPERALPLLTTASELAPADPIIYYQLARTYHALKKFALRNEAAEKAIENGYDPEAFHWLRDTDTTPNILNEYILPLG